VNGEHTKPVESRTEEQQCGHTKLFMDSFRGPERLEPCIFCEREQLRAAIVHSVSVIQTWHNMEVPEKQRSGLWDIYWRNAPEMKQIREALRGNAS
jgi:hypothetical protein